MPNSASAVQQICCTCQQKKMFLKYIFSSKEKLKLTNAEIVMHIDNVTTAFHNLKGAKEWITNDEIQTS